MVFQDPYASLNPRKRVAQIVGDPMRLHGIVDRGRGPRRGPRAARAGRAQPRALQPLPARVLGRPAPADRDRPGAVAEPEADHRRRAGLGARRLDPGADHQPARGPPGRVRAHLPVRRPRPQRRPPRRRPDRGHVPGQDRRDRARRRGLPAPDPPVHGVAACRRCRSRTRAPTPPASRSCSRATCPARPTRRRRVASTPAARGRPRSARRSSRRWSTTAAATGPPATTRSAASTRRRRRAAAPHRRR